MVWDVYTKVDPDEYTQKFHFFVLRLDRFSSELNEFGGGFSSLDEAQRFCKAMNQWEALKEGHERGKPDPLKPETWDRWVW